MERPIARPTEVDTVAVVEDGSVLNAVCVLGGGIIGTIILCDAYTIASDFRP